MWGKTFGSWQMGWCVFIEHSLIKDTCAFFVCAKAFLIFGFRYRSQLLTTAGPSVPPSDLHSSPSPVGAHATHRHGQTSLAHLLHVTPLSHIPIYIYIILDKCVYLIPWNRYVKIPGFNIYCSFRMLHDENDRNTRRHLEPEKQHYCSTIFSIKILNQTGNVQMEAVS